MHNISVIIFYFSYVMFWTSVFGVPCYGDPGVDFRRGYASYKVILLRSFVTAGMAYKLRRDGFLPASFHVSIHIYALFAAEKPS
jgi:hypothetical protein